MRSRTSPIVSRPPESVMYTQWAPSLSISLACWASGAGSFMWLIMRNPATSIPRSRALAMCWSAMSASVQWVATRTLRTPMS